MRTPGLTLILAIFMGFGCGGTSPPNMQPDAGPPDAELCSLHNELPVTVDHLLGFTSAEDFAFDGEGNYVAMGDTGDLVAITRDREVTVLAAGIGGCCGAAFLPNGDFVISGGDRVIRVTPAGVVSTIATGLEYANGLDVGRDGTIYVGETSGGRLRAIDPETGEITLIASDLPGANGVAMGPDGRKVYTGSFGYGVVWESNLDTGETRVFGQVPGIGPPPDPVNICESLTAGDPCTTQFGEFGACTDVGGQLDCVVIDPCGGLIEGDPCVATFTPDGVCTDFGGALFCQAEPQCATAGESCVTTFGGLPGVCVTSSFGLDCSEEVCVGVPNGSPCTNAFGAVGTCQSDFPPAWCLVEDPCTGLSTGAACTTTYGVAGTCYNSGLTFLACMPDETGCDALTDGAPCATDQAVAGHCAGTPLVCVEDDGCAGLAAGDLCVIDASLVGSCVDVGGGGLSCEPPNTCANATLEGVGCSEGSAIGSCQDLGAGLECETVADPIYRACDGHVLYEACQVVFPQQSFTSNCVDAPGRLYCDIRDDFFAPCVGLQEGDQCEGYALGWGIYAGTCSDDFGPLQCSQFGGGGGANGSLDGIAVDACGYVYMSDFGGGNVWRIPPAGGDADLAAQLPSSWIPNMQFGTGIGGWDAHVLYIADRDNAALYALDIGVPGAPPAFP